MTPQNLDRNVSSLDIVSFLPLGGMENVTKNMYLYQYKDEILIVDCGIGFADETKLGVDLLLPDISYLLEATQPRKGVGSVKKIVGMVLTHGHEDHIGALPFLLPQLPSFPIYGSPLTAALANEKLKEFNISPSIKTTRFDNSMMQMGSFSCSFIHVTHSVPDSANIFIRTPIGNFYHGSDFKFDLTPADKKPTEFQKIVQASKDGVLALMTDSLGAERPGYSPSEELLSESFERGMRECKGKFIITTYSSNVSRLNQAIAAAERVNRQVCFVGRSLIKVKTLAQKLGYLQIKQGTEVPIEALQKSADNELVLIIAGSQGQENSAMTRVANGEHKEVKLTPQDTVVFSSDPIPGNETSVSVLMDSLSKRGARILNAEGGERFHVSGHGSSLDHMLMMSLTQPKYILPISGTYMHMVAYRSLAYRMGYQQNQIFLLENGQELIFSKGGVRLGKKIHTRNVYVDEVSGEEVESFVLRDREKLAKDGIVIILVEIDTGTSQIVQPPDIITRGFPSADTRELSKGLGREVTQVLSTQKGRITNWLHIRKLIEDTANRYLFKKLHRNPLVLPVTIEV